MASATHTFCRIQDRPALNRFLHTEKRVGAEVNKLNKIRHVRLFKNRVFDNSVDWDVSGRTTQTLPNTSVAWYVVDNSHSADAFCENGLLTFIAKEQDLFVLSIRRLVDAIYYSVEGVELVVVHTRDKPEKSAAGYKLQHFTEDYRAFWLEYRPAANFHA